jgi:phosphate-selective porin OprO/OprP
MRHLAALLLLTAATRADDRSLNREIDNYLQVSAPPAYRIDFEPKWRRGPVFVTEDRTFRVRLRGRALWDFFTSKSDDYEDPNGAFIRQLRLGAIGFIHTNTIFMMEFDFSSGSPRPFDIFVGLQNLTIGRLKIGHMREPFGLDPTTPIPFHHHLERGASSRAFGLGRNLGIRLHNSRTGDGRFTWWIGVFTDTDNTGVSKDPTGGGAVTAKITGLPVRNFDKQQRLHLEVSASFRDVPNSTLRYNARLGPATGPRLVDTGEFTAENEFRVSGAAALHIGPFVAQAEAYAVQAELPATNATFFGGYAMASLWITGETHVYNMWNAVWDRVLPRRNFDDASGWRGAVMLSVRLDYVDLTDSGIEGGEALTLTLGATWMWNPNTRLKVDLVGADVEGGPFGTGTAYYAMTRVQFDF